MLAHVLGTKLLKPPRKLVELVAEAIDQSPDGLLQVQQIYAVLQYVLTLFFTAHFCPAKRQWASF